MKKFLAMTVIAGLATLFVACGDKKEEKAQAQTAEAAATTDNAAGAQEEAKGATEANAKEAKPAGAQGESSK